MKSFLILFFLLGMIGQAQASKLDTVLVNDIYVGKALKEAGADKVAEYEACIKESKDNNCINEVLGDIYN